MKNTPRFLSRSLFALAGLVSSAWNGLVYRGIPAPAPTNLETDHRVTGDMPHRSGRCRPRPTGPKRKNPIPGWLRTGDMLARKVKG